MGLLRLGASISTLGVVDPRSHAHRTTTNTKRIARSSAATAHATEALDQRERERELREQGLIGFNATPREVLEVEARLALERRERERAFRAERSATAQARRAERRAASAALLAQRRAAFAAARRPMPTWAFWTFGVIGLIAAVTVVGLPLTVIAGLFMWARHPWLPAPGVATPTAAVALAPAPDLSVLDAPTVQFTAPRPLVGAGRHARQT